MDKNDVVFYEIKIAVWMTCRGTRGLKRFGIPRYLKPTCCLVFSYNSVLCCALIFTHHPIIPCLYPAIYQNVLDFHLKNEFF